MVAFRQITILLVCIAAVISLPVQAADPAALKQDNPHIRRWNGFADTLLKLHQKLISQQAYTKKTVFGGYADQPRFYKEEAFYNKKTGKLISRVQWEVENPDLMHTIEVYFYDEQGRISRDFSAAYLPAYRNAPTQTLISLHAYNNQTHAFRSYDATGDHILDRCEGKYKGKNVNILLDEDELYQELDGLRLTPVYKNCVKGLPERAGVYIVPQ